LNRTLRPLPPVDAEPMAGGRQLCSADQELCYPN
jgi:hypothetical protein